MFTKLVILLGLTLFGTGTGTEAQAQARTASPVIRSGGKVLTLAWGGLTWHIPERLFFGIRTWSQDRTELWIQFGWNKNHDDFSPVDLKGYDIMLDIHPSKVDSEDPRNAFELIHRIHLPFTMVPIFSSTKFNGMTYLGSSSSFHYFILKKQDAYVKCWLINAVRLKPPKVGPDVLSKEFTCETVFIIPYETYVRVSMWGVDIKDAAPAFDAAHRLVMFFIR